MSALAGLMIAAALHYLGAPYVWKGKGDVLWTPAGLTRHAFGRPVFDCSGLVTVALFESGGKDYRATHNAGAMFFGWPIAADPEARGVLRFYGTGKGFAAHVSHVAISMGRVNGVLEVLEAAGGDQLTTCPKPGACVRVGPELRRDYLGSRVIP